MERRTRAAKPDSDRRPTVANPTGAPAAPPAYRSRGRRPSSRQRESPRIQTHSAPDTPASPAARAVCQSIDRVADQHVSRPVRRPQPSHRDAAARPDPACAETDRRRRARVGAKNAREIRGRRESRRVGASGLLVSTASGMRGGEALEHSGMPGYGPRELQQPAVVDARESAPALGRRRGSRAAANARATSVAAPSPTMRPIAILGQRSRTRLDQQRVRRLRQIAPRIDERAVEIEDDETRIGYRRVPSASARIRQTRSASPRP